MTSKQRVHAALRREATDRPPIFMWFHPDTARRLGEVLEIAPGRVSEAFGDDVRQAWVGDNYAMEGVTHERDGQGHTDFWGIEWVKEGPFNQIAVSPLAEADQAEALAYEYPYGRAEELLANMDGSIARAEELFIGCDVSPCAFEMVFRLRGMEQGILDLAAEPLLAGKMIAAAADFAVHMATLACQRFPLDWLWTGDDVAGQQSMIMSPACWRETIRPHLGRVVDVGSRRGLWTAYHSCGAIRPIIPDLIDLGVDVLNPIQCNCPGMAPLELKREFGDRLAFMGGVDTQDLLPHGTADEVRRRTAALLEGMTDGGGYILAASHTIPPETPPANIFALYEVAGVTREEIFDRAADLRAGG